jgi:uncharacterized membrane protein YqiK
MQKPQLQPAPALTQVFTAQAVPPTMASTGTTNDNAVASPVMVGLTILGTLGITAIVQWIRRGLPLDGGNLASVLNRSDDKAKMVQVTVKEVRTKDFFKLDIDVMIFLSGRPLQVEDEVAELDASIADYFKLKVEASLRSVVGRKDIAEIHGDREPLTIELRKVLEPEKHYHNLRIVDLSIGRIDESHHYNDDNFFDVQSMDKRTQMIQEAMNKVRREERAFQLKTKKEEFELERDLAKIEVQMRIERLNNESEMRKNELQVSEEIAELEKVANQKDQQRNEAMQAARLASEKNIQALENVNRQALEAEKIKEEIQQLQSNKELFEKQLEMQSCQSQEHHKLEMAELDQLVIVLEKQKEKLKAECENASIAEAINTAIESEKANSRLVMAQKAAESAEAEAKAICARANAESRRHELLPPNDADRIAAIIKELAPQLIDKLPELMKSMAPQPGILGDSNIYTFPQGSGEGIEKFILSTSSLLFLNMLLEGKLGLMVEQIIQQLKTSQPQH